VAHSVAPHCFALGFSHPPDYPLPHEVALEMTRFPCLARSVLILGCLVSSSTTTHAQVDAQNEDGAGSPLDSSPWRVALGAGMAFGTGRIPPGETINPYGVMVGARLGYVFAFPLYASIRYDHFFGSSADYPVPLVALTTYHLGASFIGGELGYEVRTGPAYLRPQIAFGALPIRFNATCDPVSGSFSDLAHQLCQANNTSSVSWAAAVAPSLPVGLRFARFYGVLAPEYYVRKTSSAYGVSAAIGMGF